MNKVAIRQFQISDAEPVQSLITSIMNQEFPQSKAAYPVDDLLDIGRIYGKNGQAFFVATDGDKIMGTVAIKREDDRAALLRRIFVDAAYRRQRIGFQLIEQAIHFCKAHHYEEVIFKTSSKMDGAIKLCQAQGFQQRAKLEIGGLELLKFVLFLGKNGKS